MFIYMYKQFEDKLSSRISCVYKTCREDNHYDSADAAHATIALSYSILSQNTTDFLLHLLGIYLTLLFLDSADILKPQILSLFFSL
ncbi:unnamed protein product [Citrullus colocynthis]|uniref:Uncharacterized protein n=1 Tax=Citrullus colocynthis TaxID=252529 RepID=A0ABP0XMI4_9ROSI